MPVIGLRFVKLKRGPWVQDDEKRLRPHDYIAEKGIIVDIDTTFLESDSYHFELSAKTKEEG